MEKIELFPLDINLDDAREAIKGCIEFFEKHENDTIIFSYKFCTHKTFPSLEQFTGRELLLQQVKRECRGLIFHKETGEILSRRYHKFFNVGELPETHPDKLDFSRPYIVLTKYDGQLVTPLQTQGKIMFASKSGVGEITKLIESRFLVNPENERYVHFSSEWLSKGYTPIFEWCSPGSKVVLDYGADLMVLTGIRHMRTGEYVKYSMMQESANQYQIKITEVHVGTITDFLNFQKDLQAKENIEGIVIRFEDDGSMYKVKTTWYFQKSHKEKQEFSLASERSIWKLILDQEIDDALVFANDAKLSERVKPFEDLLYASIENTSRELEKIASTYRNEEKKHYVEKIKQLSENDVQTDYFKQLSDKEKLLFLENIKILLLKMHDPNVNSFELLLDHIKKNCSSQTKLSICQLLLGVKLY